VGINWWSICLASRPKDCPLPIKIKQNSKWSVVSFKEYVSNYTSFKSSLPVGVMRINLLQLNIDGCEFLLYSLDSSIYPHVSHTTYFILEYSSMGSTTKDEFGVIY
jgi:hypothetical protein